MPAHPSAKVNQQLPRHLQAGLEAVFMKAITGPGAAEISVLFALQLRQSGLRTNGRKVKNRMCVIKFTHDVITLNLAHRIQ